MSARVLLRSAPLILTLAAALWCVWIGVLIWNTPRGPGVTLQATTDGSRVEIPTRGETRTFGEIWPMGWVVLAVPFILACGVAITARFQAPGFMAVATGFFLGFVFVTGFSIGGAFHGPALLLGIATLLEAVLALRERRRVAATA